MYVVPVPIEAADVVGTVGQGEDDMVGGSGWHNGFCKNRCKWLAGMVVQPGHRSLTCWPAAGICTRVLGFPKIWGKGPGAMLSLEWKRKIYIS